MEYSKNNVGLPKIPSVSMKVEEVQPPKKTAVKKSSIEEFEHIWELIYHFLVLGVRNLKKIIKLIIIPFSIVMVLNIILESIPTYSLTGIVRPIAFFFISITASYNSLIPRTIYWIVIFTVGKRMAFRIKREGFSTTFNSIKNLPGVIANSRKALGKSNLFVLSAAVGLGFISANYLTRNNRFDKVSVVIVIAIVLLDTLSKGNKTTLFTAIRLIHNDLSGIVKKKPIFTDNHVYISISGLIMGLLGNLIFGVIKLDFGGYIIGSILLIAGIVLIHTEKNEVKKN